MVCRDRYAERRANASFRNDRTVNLAVLAPVRNESPSLSGHLCACLRAVSRLDIEIVLLDNQSIDGCCRGLPREVLIVRTERVESLTRLWLLGLSLASGENLLWLPGILSYRPDRFRSLVLAAIDLGSMDGVACSVHKSRRRRFVTVPKGCALVTPKVRSQVDRWGSNPILGRTFFGVAALLLRVVIPLRTIEDERAFIDAGSDVADTATSVRQLEMSSVARGIARTDQPSAITDAGWRQVSPTQPGDQRRAPTPRRTYLLSAIITAHNEGREVLRTVESIRANTRLDHEIIVVDDGSTDGCCDGLEAMDIRVIRHAQRVGVACSRDAGSRSALGEVFAYLDAHQRVEPGCLDRCAEVAASYESIACPPCRPLNRRYPVSYGASFEIDTKRRFFSARHRTSRPRQEVTRISALRSPAYVIPRAVYHRVAWIAGLRGWGATDFSVAVKAFFTDVDILHVNTGATEHLFRKRIPYETSWEGVWRNHALIARVCFDDRTWARYWLPEVFRGNLSDEVLRELDSPAVLDEREAFMAVKVRPDREFWRGLLRIPEPKPLL
jgi:glycosyltransferase involved in cell wall biosynthesis